MGEAPPVKKKKRKKEEIYARMIVLGQQGRSLLLGELDEKLLVYVRALRDAGGSMGSIIVITTAEGIVTAHDRTLLVKYAGHINLTCEWALSLLILPNTTGYNTMVYHFIIHP